MEIDKEIEAQAEKMAKSTRTEKEVLIDLVRELGTEGIKKALPTLSETQQVLLKSVLAEELSKSMKLDDKIIAAPVIEAKIGETKLQEEVANDDADEKIAAAAESDVNHQGGEKQDGWEGQIIKSEEIKSEEPIMNFEEIVKSMTEEQKSEFSSKLIAKGVAPEKISAMMDKKIAVSEKKEDAEDKKEHKEIKQEIKKSEEPKMSWEDPSRLLKACTGGRNHHFSVNGYYDEVLTKSKEEVPTDLKKSEVETISDILEKGGDCSPLDIQNKKRMEAEKAKQNGKVQKSFGDVDMAAALGLSEEECRKILGDV